MVRDGQPDPAGGTVNGARDGERMPTGDIAQRQNELAFRFNVCILVMEENHDEVQN